MIDSAPSQHSRRSREPEKEESPSSFTVNRIPALDLAPLIRSIVVIERKGRNSADNPPEAVANFEALFRRNLRALYAVLGLAAPPQLDQSLCRGGGSPEAGGTMRRGSGATIN